jgi:hypothetical protein
VHVSNKPAGWFTYAEHVNNVYVYTLSQSSFPFKRSERKTERFHSGLVVDTRQYVNA